MLHIFCLTLLLLSPVWAKDARITKAEVLLKTDSSWDGQTLPEYTIGKPEITIIRFTIPPKSQLPMHKHPVINAGVLIKGKLTVVKESGELLYLDTGDTLAELVNQWHYGRNESMEPAEIIVFYAGIEGEPITIKK